MRDGSDKPRVALYSHDAMGIGHVRRNLLIAKKLAASPCNATILLIAGAREAGVFSMPEGVDYLTVPSLRKVDNGNYRARSLQISKEEMTHLRASAMRAAIGAFEPNVLIVDKVPRGVDRELEPTLSDLRTNGNCRCVLGLRDVLDNPETIQSEWRACANEEAIRRFYDAIWVYGDPRIVDLASENQFSSHVAAKMHYTGYFDQRERLTGLGAETPDPLEELGFDGERFVLCLVGGGEDGACLAEAFAMATLPPTTNAVLVAGPFMPRNVRQRLHRRALENPRLRVLDFVSEADALVHRADRVIAMGGYNTVCAVLSFDKPALIVPRTEPRQEQLIRAERFQKLGLVDMVHPREVNPQVITDWLKQDHQPPRSIRERVDLNGLDRLPDLLYDVMESPSERCATSTTQRAE